MENELKRKIVHITMVGWALCIGRFSPTLICILCLVALHFNLIILPRLTKKGLERQVDLQRGYSLGMLAYPFILCVLSIVFYRQQIFLAIAWGAMAFGDGLAGLIGERLPGPKIPWNAKKSLAGSLAFVLLGTPLTIGLVHLLPEQALLGMTLTRWHLAIFSAMMVAGLMETVEGLIDDNLVVPVVAAVVSYVVMHVEDYPNLPDQWWLGLGMVIMLMASAVGLRKIDLSGGITGALLAWVIYLGGGLTGLALLFLFFVMGSAASHWKMKEKEKMGLAQENRGQRTVRHALSNGGVAALCGLLAWIFPQEVELWQIALAASLASATADTISSELGNVYGTRYINIITFKQDERGRDGVISLQGTALGFIAALVVALTYTISQGSLRALLVVTLAGLVGNVADSILGASLQRRGYMTNDTVNFANTAIAACIAAILTGWLPLA